MIDWKQKADEIQPQLVARRRDFHQHPEIAFEEHRTAEIVSRRLNELGLEVQTGVGGTGVIGILEGREDGPTVLVRADMDALPVQEANQTDYASRIANRMHACGHDGHTSIALGVAELLSPMRDELQGRVKFVFQPAEEVALGAKAMVADGALESPRPDITVGLHLWNSLPLGKLGMTVGPAMAGASNFRIVVTGRGGHAASPHLTVDPVVCAAHIVSALQTIVSRNNDPFDSAVITVASIHGGDGAYNIIPQSAEMVGTIRFFRDEVHAMISDRMTALVTQMAAAFGCTATVEIVPRTVPVVNHADVAGLLRPRFEQVVGLDNVDDTIRSMGAEDVGVFMNDVPGLYFFVGAQDLTQDQYYPHHHPKFSFDERALSLGTALLTDAVAAYLLPDD
jgi:amidohydrolase